MCRLLLIPLSGILLLLLAVTDGRAVLCDVTWDTAISTCRERGEKLYNTTNKSALGDVKPGSYWIGGKVQYSSWMWTADKKSLFEYAGEMNESYATSNRGYTILYDNQASRCYYECRRQQNNRKPMFVGLQDSTCYCFGSLSPGSIMTDNRTHRGCLGNFMECCGTDGTISIYRPELINNYAYITWTLNPAGTCAYVTQSENTIVHAEENCTTQKGHICNCSDSELNYTCVNHTMDRSWFSANTSCTLKTLNENNVEYTRQHMRSGVSYWIGLKRSKYIVWIDRDERVNTDISYNRSGCLMMQKQPSGDISFHISNCSEQKPALCLTNVSSLETRVPPCNKPTTYGGSTANPLSDDKNDQTGVAVGVSVAVVVLVVAGTLLAVFWMKRSKRFCFETKSDSAAFRGQSEGERESDYDQIKEISNYEFESIPKGNVPNTSRYLTLDTSTNRTATTAHANTDEDDYNVLSHNSPPHSPVKSNADAYSQVNVKKKGKKRFDVIDDDDYDTAGSSVTSSRDPTYNHVIDDVTDGDYDKAGSNITSAHDPTYNHITGSQIDDITDGDYDTAGSNVMSACDPTYSHIKGEVEGDYSTAGGDSRVEPGVSDDYSHIGEGYV